MNKSVQIINKHSSSGGSAVYGLGLVGALVYYLQDVATFGDGIIGILKAVVWPAFLIYSSLDFFKL